VYKKRENPTIMEIRIIAPWRKARNDFPTLYGSIHKLLLVGFVRTIQVFRAIKKEIQSHGSRYTRL
jgi:hypothetical protein